MRNQFFSHQSKLKRSPGRASLALHEISNNLHITRNGLLCRFRYQIHASSHRYIEVLGWEQGVTTQD